MKRDGYYLFFLQSICSTWKLASPDSHGLLHTAISQTEFYKNTHHKSRMQYYSIAVRKFPLGNN